MKRLLLTILSLGALCSVSAYEPLPLDIDKMDGFHTIRINGNLCVEVLSTQANPAMHIEMMDNDPRRFDWSVKDSVLNISFSANSKSRTTPMLTLWSNSPVKQLSVSRADVKFPSTMAVTLLDISLKEGARLSAEVECLDLRLNMKGSSVAEIDGKATYQNIEVQQKCALKADRLDSRSIELKAKGASEVYVNAEERAIMEAANRTSVFYNGNPAIVRTQTKMSATINSIGAR